MRAFLMALVLFLSGGMATEAHAEARWQNFGEDRAYSTRDAAMRDVDNVMQRAGWPSEVRQLMLQQVRDSGTEVTITKGERYDTMRSGKTALWRNVLVDFVRPPLQGVQGVEYAVRGERWVVTWQGRTWELTLPQVCNNWLTRIVGQEARLDCVYDNVEVRDPNEFAIIWARYNYADDPCFAVRQVSQLFEADSPTATWQTVPRGCIGIPCDLTAVNRALGRQQKAQGQIPITTPGFYQIRHAPNELMVYCLKLRGPNGSVTSSFAAGFRWQQDYVLKNGTEYHARGYYHSQEAVADGIPFGGPRFLTWWATNGEDEARMRGLAGRTQLASR